MISPEPALFATVTKRTVVGKDKGRSPGALCPENQSAPRCG